MITNDKGQFSLVIMPKLNNRRNIVIPKQSKFKWIFNSVCDYSALLYRLCISVIENKQISFMLVEIDLRCMVVGMAYRIEGSLVEVPYLRKDSSSFD